MNDKNKIVVTKEEVKEEWIDAEKASQNLQRLLNKAYSYSGWATNVSIGLLGFFLATLLQIKSQKALFGTVTILVIFSSLTASIIIGFVLKVRYEIIQNYNSLRRNFSTLAKFINVLSDKLNEKRGQYQKDSIQHLDGEIVKFSTIENWIRKYPFKLIIAQIILVIFSILQISFYLLYYIFFKSC